jgi:hypothetical protein
MGKDQQYVYDGEDFPCLTGCSEVLDLPFLTVRDYLHGQNTELGHVAQDAYLELMQRLADGAFVLLLESGLAASGDKLTLRGWRSAGRLHPKQRAQQLPSHWLDRLMLPDLTIPLTDPQTFATVHHDILQSEAQKAFAYCQSKDDLRAASCLMFSLALHLGRGLGSDSEHLADRWIATAKKHGAHE